MRVQAMWAAVVVVLQVLGCCWAFGSYPGTFYQMMLLLNKERKYARTAPSPSRLWAIFNPAATLGSLSNVPLDSNRVVRRDLEPRQVQEPTIPESTTLAEKSQSFSGGSELPSKESHPTSEGQVPTSEESESLSEVAEPTEPITGESEPASGGLNAKIGGSDAKSEPLRVESQSTNGEGNGGLVLMNPGPVTRIPDATNGGSEVIIGKLEFTSERTYPTEGTSEAPNTISEEPIAETKSSSGGFDEVTEPVTEASNDTSEAPEPVTDESNTASEELEPTKTPSGELEPMRNSSGELEFTKSPSGELEPTKSPSGELEPTKSPSGELEPTRSPSGELEHEGTKVGCGEEMVMPSPPASQTPTQGFTLKQNLSTPGWDEGHYPEDVECVWTLKVGRECEVGLLLYQVMEGEVLQSPRCTGDYLEFVQPNSHATRYCGPLVNNRDKVSGIDSWHSSQERTTTIRFRSELSRSLQDRSISGAPRGFVMEVTYYCWLYNKAVTS